MELPTCIQFLIQKQVLFQHVSLVNTSIVPELSTRFARNVPLKQHSKVDSHLCKPVEA